jgi:DNA-binding ferritin-like protein
VKRKRALKEIDEIKEALGRTESHVEKVREMIEKYAQFIDEVRSLSAKQAEGENASPAARRLNRIASNVEKAVSSQKGAIKTAEEMKALSGRMIAAIEKKDSPEAIARIGGEIRDVGTALESVLAKYRMAMRMMKQECRMAGKDDPAAGFVAQMRKRVEGMLGGGGDRS